MRLPVRQPFEVRLHLFDTSDRTAATWTRAIETLNDHGIGPGQGRARLEHAHGEMIRACLEPEPSPAERVTVHFLTPTELKSHGLLAGPDFGVLLARCRDRVSMLSALYGEGPLEIDYRGMAERAAHVLTVRSHIQHESVERHSSRTGQVHPLGGFTGEVEYVGALGEFLPYLEAAAWTGVGRQTPWGKGEIVVQRHGAPVPQCP